VVHSPEGTLPLDRRRWVRFEPPLSLTVAQYVRPTIPNPVSSSATPELNAAATTANSFIP